LAVVTAPLYIWRPPFEFPACWDWSEDQPLPEGVTIVKADEKQSASLKICIESVNKISITKKNIAEINVDVKVCITGLLRKVTLPPPYTPEKACDEAMRHIKTVHDKVDVEVTSDVKTEKFCFVLPTEWRFYGILKENAPVPFEVTDTNKVCFTITHESPTLITIQLVSDRTQTVQATTNALTLFVVVMMLMMIVRMFKLRR